MTKAQIKDVTDTAYWVAHFRARETDRDQPLFMDPLAKELVGEYGKRISDTMSATSRYTEWSVISRTVIIDRFIHALIKEGVDTVINLGAGLDTRPYRMELPGDFSWFEVDHPRIIAHKSEVLKLKRPRCRLTRLEVDLTDTSKRKELLGSIAPQAKKALVLTEGVIPYLSPAQVAALGEDLLAQSRFTYWITEYFHPKVYRYLKNSRRMAALKNSPFLFYPDDWFGFFKQTGWVEKETRYSGEIAVEFNRKLPMPWWVKLIMPLIPNDAKEAAGRMSGYSVLKRAN